MSTDRVINGMTKWNELIDGRKIHTPTQKTGNNGLHYLFKVSKDVFDKLPASITELSINGLKYSIDFKGKNQFVIVEPSKYEDKFYKWKNDFSIELQDMPKWLLDILLNHSTKKVNQNQK